MKKRSRWSRYREAVSGFLRLTKEMVSRNREWFLAMDRCLRLILCRFFQHQNGTVGNADYLFGY